MRLDQAYNHTRSFYQYSDVRLRHTPRASPPWNSGLAKSLIVIALGTSAGPQGPQGRRERRAPRETVRPDHVDSFPKLVTPRDSQPASLTTPGPAAACPLPCSGPAPAVTRIKNFQLCQAQVGAGRGPLCSLQRDTYYCISVFSLHNYVTGVPERTTIV